jgi:hypothetical protein
LIDRIGFWAAALLAVNRAILIWQLVQWIF